MRYRERLTVPGLWWVLGALFALSLAAALGFYLGPWWALGTGLAATAAVVSTFWMAAVPITVGDEAVRVGRAWIEVAYLSGARALDAAETRRRAGPDADARAYLVLRPYVPTAVEITLDDPDDPVPYWLVSSRRPRPLAQALNQAISSRVTR